MLKVAGLVDGQTVRCCTSIRCTHSAILGSRLDDRRGRSHQRYQQARFLWSVVSFDEQRAAKSGEAAGTFGLELARNENASARVHLLTLKSLT